MEKINKKALLRDSRDPGMVHVLDVADELGIRYELVYKEGWQYVFRMSRKGKSEYVVNAMLGKNLDRLICSLVDKKDFVKGELRKRGLKTPSGFSAGSMAEIRKGMKASGLRFPVVLKPGQMSCGHGVVANIATWQDMQKAYSLARRIEHARKHKPVIVEEHFHGRDFRLLVLDGRLIACSERIHPRVVGDGRNKVRDLIRGQLRTGGHGAMKMDWEVERTLKRQKIGLGDVPEKGRIVRLRENANIATGGICADRTGEVSARFRKMAVDCAELFNLRLAGVDVITSDISENDPDYRIIEVNINPDFFMHDDPDIGPRRDIAKTVLKKIFRIR